MFCSFVPSKKELFWVTFFGQKIWIYLFWVARAGRLGKQTSPPAAKIAVVETSKRSLAWGFLGTVPYREGVSLQRHARERIRGGEGGDTLFFLEHPHVYTLGRSTDRSDLRLDERRLGTRGAAVESTDRGGQVTYHGPGQLVGYPILDLNPDRRDIRRYVADLEQVLVRTLAEYGVEARGRTRQPWTGVWVGERKIASIGVHLSRWITTHGFALNVSTDLSFFRDIVPCGLPDVEMTSIESLTGRRPGLDQVATVCAGFFAEVFERRLEPLPENPIQTWATGL